MYFVYHSVSVFFSLVGIQLTVQSLSISSFYLLLASTDLPKSIKFSYPRLLSVLAPQMDERLTASARTGNVSELYRLIERDGNILRRFDEVEFVDTPLHIASKEGCIGFAMEIMNLKPSFARKLNHQGLSPIHLAVQNGHKELVLRFVEIDKDLVRVRGKEGETVLHYISKVGNPDGLLDRFLEVCPDCIRDVTTQNRTSLHIAVKNERFDVFQVLVRMIRKKDYYREVMNQKDEDGNTALHIAASSNQPQVLKLLLECKADKHVTNQDGLTALDLAHQHNNKEIINIMRSCFCPRVLDFKYKMKKQIIHHTTMASSLFSYDTDNISSDDRNALLDRTANTTCISCNWLRPINMSNSPTQISIETYDDIFGTVLGFDSVHV
ncbi:hypothetical protein V6N12_037161 [Hibiscus sabdariffa]|uniref:Uncharacterized protein n=1 Tax=Hibiscus sabdariffa TaxID=183260 RepID=A0ABR1ZKV2_9ROSI